MRTRPPTPGKRQALTFAALAFALGSIVWSANSIRQWLEEHRGWGQIEMRSRRSREADPPEDPGPTPTNARLALAVPSA